MVHIIYQKNWLGWDDQLFQNQNQQAVSVPSPFPV